LRINKLRKKLSKLARRLHIIVLQKKQIANIRVNTVSIDGNIETTICTNSLKWNEKK